MSCRNSLCQLLPRPLVAALQAIALVATACAADWPQWGGAPERNMASFEKGLPATFDPGKKRPDGSAIDPATPRNVLWAARLGSETCSSPTVAGMANGNDGGVLYVASQHYLWAVGQNRGIAIAN